MIVCTWAQDERPADLYMTQPDAPVSKTGHILTDRLIHGGRAMREAHTPACFSSFVIAVMSSV
jgi:hypothetical protein